MEGRGPEDSRGGGRTAIAHNRYRATATKRRFVTHVRPRGVPRRVARRRFALLVRAARSRHAILSITRSRLRFNLEHNLRYQNSGTGEGS